MMERILGDMKSANKRDEIDKSTIRLNPTDNVVVAATDLPPEKEILSGSVVTVEKIPAGHKVATEHIPVGVPIRKYGQVIGYASRNIQPGEHVHIHNVEVKYLDQEYEIGVELRDTRFAEKEQRKSFLGIERPYGKVGTRNYIGILPTVMCSASVASRIAEHFTDERIEMYPNVDGVVALPHQTGCGDSGLGREFSRRTLAGYARHPNFGGVLLVGLGCEDNQVDSFMRDMSLKVGDTLRALSIHDLGGSNRTIQKGITTVEEMLPVVDRFKRTTVSASKIVVGLECGGSDAFSGITANPALGVASDLVIKNGGTAVFSETPEIYGAEHLLTRRAISRKVGEKIIESIQWWKKQCEINGVELNNNPSPGNLQGGITTILEKSLGAISKGGSTNLVDVYKYAEAITASGLVFMDTTSHDIASVTGKIAGGANVICFTTGRGTPVGAVPVPVIKLTSNTSTYEQQFDDIDINCGEILDGKATLEEMGERIFEFILDTVSGRKTRSEEYGFGSLEFTPWQIGVVF
jgi:altronate hydrolase